MKLFVRMIVIAIALFSVGGPLAAQSKHQRISREALAEVQAKHIASELSLDEATTQKFVDTYTQFQKELWALRPRTKRNLQKAQTDEEIDRAMQARFEQSQKILELRKQYYAHSREFRSPKQVQQVYQKERQMMKKLQERRKDKMRR